MAEIRLICPGCAAEYRVPDSAIPPEGREVECSACGKVWHSTPRLDLSDFQAPLAESPAELPRLNRRLPDSVLDILRDEVEHERRARAAEHTDLPAPAATAPRLMADPEWPATTITRHSDPRPAEPAPAAAPEPLPSPPAPTPAVEAQSFPTRAAKAQPAPMPVPPADAEPDAPAQPDLPAVVPAPAPSGRGGYGAGFALALMLAAGLVALYLLAPRLADQGAVGERLMDLRADLDQARLRLQNRANVLIR